MAEQKRQEEQLAAGARAVLDLEKVQSELAVERCRANTLELELRANEDAVQQRHIMRDKLARYNELERENASLVERNKLLVQTADNSALLREKVQQLEQDVTRMGGKLKDMARVTGELEVAKQVNSGKEHSCVCQIPKESNSIILIWLSTLGFAFYLLCALVFPVK